MTGAGAALGRGALIGFGMFAAVIANIGLLGGYRVDGWGSVAGALALLGFMAAAAVTEELIFRGVLFRIVEGRIGTWLALALTGLLFGLAHLFNPHATLWGALAIAIEAGGMLAAAYAATRNLWVPIGLHFGWNFAEGGIFGTDVSGKSGPQGLLHGVLSGPTALSGGEFGPEASVYAVLAGVVMTVAVPAAGPPPRPPRAAACAGHRGPRHRYALPVMNLQRILDRWRRLHVTVRDLPLALVLAVASLVPALHSHGTQLGDLPTRPFDALAVAVAALECLPLAVRRRWPAACLALVSLGFAVDQLRGYHTVAGIALPIALLSAGAYLEPPSAHHGGPGLGGVPAAGRRPRPARFARAWSGSPRSTWRWPSRGGRERGCG